MLKNMKWNALITALVYIVSGIALIIYPEQIQNIICNILGIAGIVLGIIRVFVYLSSNVEDSLYRNDFVEGIILILVGILIIYQKKSFQILIPSIIAIVIIVDGFAKLQDGIDAKRLGYQKSWIYVLFAAISIIIGLVVMMNLIEAGNFLFQVLGAGMVYCGITDLVSVLFLTNRIKKYIKVGEELIKEAQKEQEVEEKEQRQ